MSARVAIYAAPPAEDALWRFGSDLVGYDAATGEDCGFADDLPVDAATWSDWTADPRRYGFHATLKAPFRLAEGARIADAEALAESLAARTAPVTVPRLAVRLLGRFVALVPAEPSARLEALAAACVEAFEPVRAAPTPEETARRLRSPLSPRQHELLERYGYPYVLDQFRFHMTLTGRLPAQEAERVRAHLDVRYERLAPGLCIDALCLFVQPAPGERFRIARRIALRG